MRGTRVGIIAGIPLLIAAAAGWYAASPWWTLRQMAAAAREHDAAALSGYIDYPRLRATTKVQVHEYFDRLSTRPISENGSIMLVAADLIANEAVDRLITPAGMMAIFAVDRAQTEARAGAGAPPPPDRGAAKSLGLDAANREIVREGLDGFRLRKKGQAGQDGDLIFERHGLGWKLARIQVPDALLGR